MGQPEWQAEFVASLVMIRGTGRGIFSEKVSVERAELLRTFGGPSTGLIQSYVVALIHLLYFLPWQ